jgi:hypothetical protein
LELGISLVFGAWFLVFRFRNFSGAWGLVLGVSLGGGSKTGMRPCPCPPRRNSCAPEFSMFMMRDADEN